MQIMIFVIFSQTISIPVLAKKALGVGLQIPVEHRVRSPESSGTWVQVLK
jgi:hypothetical protein